MEELLEVKEGQIVPVTKEKGLRKNVKPLWLSADFHKYVNSLRDEKGYKNAEMIIREWERKAKMLDEAYSHPEKSLYKE